MLIAVRAFARAVAQWSARLCRRSTTIRRPRRVESASQSAEAAPTTTAMPITMTIWAARGCVRVLGRGVLGLRRRPEELDGRGEVDAGRGGGVDALGRVERAGAIGVALLEQREDLLDRPR